MFLLDLLRRPLRQPLNGTLLHFLWQGPAIMAIGLVSMNFGLSAEHKARADEVQKTDQESKVYLEKLASQANPLKLDDETLIKLFDTGRVLQRIAFDCKSFYREKNRLPKDVDEIASRYVEKMREKLGSDPFAPGKKLRLVPVPNRPQEIQVWSVGPDGDWDGGREIDSTKRLPQKPLDGDIGLLCHVLDQFHEDGFLADSTISLYLDGLRLPHYLAAKGPKFPEPELKDDGLAWGPVVDGLQLAVELKPKRDSYYLGEVIDVRFHVRNAADYVIQIGTEMPIAQNMGQGSVFIENEKGEPLEGESIWMSGWSHIKRKTLKPGETTSYDSTDLAFVAPGQEPNAGPVGYWVEAEPGVYTVRFSQRFRNDSFHSDARQWNGELETARIKVRIAKEPKFALYLVKGYRKPGEKPESKVQIYFDICVKEGCFDAMHPERYPLDDLIFDGTPLVTESDIVSYDWDGHDIRLTPEAYKRLIKIKQNVLGVPFLVRCEGKPIYLGAFWTDITSFSAAMPTISMDPWRYKLPKYEPDYLPENTIHISNDRMFKVNHLRPDPRRDERLHDALKQMEKLLDPQSEKSSWPWGKPVEKIQTRLQPYGLFANEKSSFSFALRNGSSELSVQLGPGGIPLDILVDGKSYYWSGRIAGKMPICEPGERIHEALFQLHQDWFTKDKNGKGKPLDLTPGKHVVQAVVYAKNLKEENHNSTGVKIFTNEITVTIVK